MTHPTQAAGAAEPSDGVRIFWIEKTDQFCIHPAGEAPIARAWKRLYTYEQALALSTATAPSAPTDAKSAAPAAAPEIPEGCTPADARVLREANHTFAAENQMLRDALQYYADRRHFLISDDSAWDTVSGEPTNFWCDEAGTATIEDGTVAAMALRGTPLVDDEEAAPSAPMDAKSTAPAVVGLMDSEKIAEPPKVATAFHEYDHDNAFRSAVVRSVLEALSAPMPAAPSALASAAPSSVSAEQLLRMKVCQEPGCTRPEGTCGACRGQAPRTGSSTPGGG